MSEPWFNEATGRWVGLPESRTAKAVLEGIALADADQEKSHFCVAVEQLFMKLNHRDPRSPLVLGRRAAAIIGAWYDDGIDLDLVEREMREWDRRARKTVRSPAYFDARVREAQRIRQSMRAPNVEI